MLSKNSDSEQLVLTRNSIYISNSIKERRCNNSLKILCIFGVLRIRLFHTHKYNKSTLHDSNKTTKNVSEAGSE